VTSAQAAADAADQNQLAATAAAGDAANDTLKVLVVGDAYIAAHPDLDECPLCESAENVAGLGVAIKSRLSQLEALQAATTEWRKQHDALNTAKQAQQQAEIDYTTAVNTFAAAQSGHAWKADVVLPSEATPTDPTGLPAWLAANASLAETWATVDVAWRDESQSRAQTKTVLERFQTNTDRVKELNALIPKVEDALSQCMEERKAFSDGIMSDIAEKVGELYELVHPGEGLNKIAFELDPKKRASLEFKAQFSNQNAPPQAYFSQSHLDTLGLCVFLALSLRDQPEATILVLDDVLSSVDEPHVERVIGMIYEVSTKFQHTVVTTHYRPWREKFRWGLLKPDQVCQFVELTAWSLSHGLALSGSIPEIVRLKTLLGETPPDVQSITGKAGVILEALLDFLTLKYGCAVPRRSGGTYTLGELLPAINGKLLAALKVESLDHSGGSPSVISATDLKPILDEITKIAAARNVLGAHYNPNAFDLYPNDGINFAKEVEKLADALICPEHGWPTKDKSGTHWANGGETRRLHPLKKPA
jgi:hypothetical protein